MTTLVIRQAASDEFDVVFGLLAESIQWLRSKGLDQWSTWEQWRTKMRPSLDRGDVWLLCDGEDPIGTVTAEMGGDPDFWTPEELAEPAAYVSKLTVARSHAGLNLGQLLLEWASDHAYRYGCEWLRLDAWKTNERLHSYYGGQGWKYLRTEEAPGRHSGTLFQTPTKPLTLKTQRELKEIPSLPTLESVIRAWPESADPAGNWRPSHVHSVDTLVIDIRGLGPRIFQVVPGYRYRLRRNEASWLMEVNEVSSYWKEIGRVHETGLQLVASEQYVITHNDRKPCSVKVTQTVL